MIIKQGDFIVLANSSLAKIYRYDSKNHKIVYLKEIGHCESTLKTRDIMADKAGQHQKSFSYGNEAYEPHTDPKKVETIKFASELAESLKTEIKDDNHVVIFAPGHFQGLLKDKLKSPFLDKVVKFIDKDFTKLHIKDLEKHISDTLGLKL